MRYYFKDASGGFGFSINQDIVGQIIWITEEEYNELLAAAALEEESSVELG